MSSDLLRKSPARLAFWGAFAVALGFALYTNHTWEDYYITYRSSRNLATGHGLVFNLGDRLHTFTSPLGVLLPALASLLTGNTSDPGALWIFRVMCATAFGGAALLLGRIAARQHGTWIAGGLLAAWLATDAKSVDFTINGMETALMLLFLAYALWSHLTASPRAWLHLGAAWAGLMWTRPDSFIYVTLIATGFWLFPDEAQTPGGRRELLGRYLRAGLVTTALYLPWLLWAWWYYGTPIPHTITAKGGIGDTHTLAGLLATTVQLPYLAWAKSSSLELTFLPSYYMIGGWPAGLIHLSRALATLCCLLWLLPFLHRWARAASFAFFGAHVYLPYFPYFPFPWYIPSTTLLALVALAGLVAWLLSGPKPGTAARAAAGALSLVLLAGNVWTLVEVARQVRAQQQLVEDGNRRKIGEWLHAHAAPGDTVFMEPLGYIGFFSGLKTYDWPGMSSREMVAARRMVGSEWIAIIQYLQPSWLVLRSFEAERLAASLPSLLTDNYRPVQEFDCSAALARVSVHGLPYLQHDSRFIVYRLHHPGNGLLVMRHRGSMSPPTRSELPARVLVAPYNHHQVSVIGVPSILEFPVPALADELVGGLGILDDTWFGPEHSAPVKFSITMIRPGGTEQVLLEREIDPLRQPADRGYLAFRVKLPAAPAGTFRFSIRQRPGAAVLAKAFWADLEAVPVHINLELSFADGGGRRQIPASESSESRFGFTDVVEDGMPCLLAHAPATLAYDWSEGMEHLTATFGMIRGAYAEGKTTEGVIFVVVAEDASGRRTELYRRHLDPVGRPTDRGPQALNLVLPHLPGGRLLLKTEPPPSGHLNNA
jgi:hypothetical protein